jgi:hypothetical protein
LIQVPHKFKIDQKVWLSDTKWLGPDQIVDLNKNNAKLQIKNNKFKIVNCARLKPFLTDANENVCPEEQRLSQGDSSLFQDTNIPPLIGQSLEHYKN